jgi:hypothetical protein
MSAEASPTPFDSERRAWVRYHSRDDTPLFLIGEHEVIHAWKAKVRDVSQGGISLNVTYPFEVGKLVDVELTATGIGAARTLVARVVRIERVRGPVWCVACVFDTPLPVEEVAQIAEEQGDKQPLA